MAKHKPFILLGPGDTIREELEFYGWTQEDLAEITGLSAKHISQLASNKAAVTFETACLLSRVFKQGPQFWLNADARYRLALEESASGNGTAARALIYRYMPVRDMRKKGLLPSDKETLVPAVLEFWGHETLCFDFMRDEVKKAACFRRTSTRQINPFFALTWLRAARNAFSATTHPNRPFDAERLSRLTENLSSYTTRTDGIGAAIRELRGCGVVFLHVPHFEKTYTDGAVFWENNTPVLAYTCRYDRNDNFWFTLAHEIAHILRHRDQNSPVFIDSLDHLDLEDQREDEANEFAGKHLRIPEIVRMFIGLQRISRKRVVECARIMGVHPAIVVGALQFEGRIKYQALNDQKEPVRHQIAARSPDALSGNGELLGKDGGVQQ